MKEPREDEILKQKQHLFYFYFFGRRKRREVIKSVNKQTYFIGSQQTYARNIHIISVCAL